MTTPSGPRDSVVKVRPTYEVAVTSCNFDAHAYGFPAWETTPEEDRDEYRAMATAVLTRLRELGAFNIEFLEAIKAEERK